MKICRRVMASDGMPERQWNPNMASDDMGLMGVRNQYSRSQYSRSFDKNGNHRLRLQYKQQDSSCADAQTLKFTLPTVVATSCTLCVIVFTVAGMSWTESRILAQQRHRAHELEAHL